MAGARLFLWWAMRRFWVPLRSKHHFQFSPLESVTPIVFSQRILIWSFRWPSRKRLTSAGRKSHWNHVEGVLHGPTHGIRSRHMFARHKSDREDVISSDVDDKFSQVTSPTITISKYSHHSPFRTKQENQSQTGSTAKAYHTQPIIGCPPICGIIFNVENAQNRSKQHPPKLRKLFHMEK